MTREQKGKPTAGELFDMNRERDLERGYYGWEAFCVVPDYCTKPCYECGRDGRLAREDAESRKRRKQR